MRPGSVLRSSRSELVREDGGENPRQREQLKHSNEKMRNSLVCASVAVRDTKGDTGKGMKRASRLAAAGLVCPEVTGANRLVLKRVKWS